MSDALCDIRSGTIQDAPFAALLIEGLRQRATGALQIQANGGMSRVFFRAGRPCGANIFFGFKPLGQFLLEMGWIDMEALEKSLGALAKGQKQGQALLEMGAITDERLRLGLALLHARNIRTLSAVEEGSYSFTSLAELPDWTEPILISAYRSILDALVAKPAHPIVDRILARLPAGQGLKLRDGWRRFGEQFELDAYEQRFAERLEHAHDVAQLAASSGLVPPRKALAMGSCFLLMGLAFPASLPAAAPAP